MARSIHTMNMNDVDNMVACCLIMHNMCDSDEAISGDVKVLYNPAVSVEENVVEAGSMEIPSDLEDVLKESAVMMVPKQVQWWTSTPE